MYDTNVSKSVREKEVRHSPNSTQRRPTLKALSYEKPRYSLMSLPEADIGSVALSEACRSPASPGGAMADECSEAEGDGPAPGSPEPPADGSFLARMVGVGIAAGPRW